MISLRNDQLTIRFPHLRDNLGISIDFQPVKRLALPSYRYTNIDYEHLEILVSEMIDIGIGSGIFIKYAQKYNYNISGYDINKYSINWLKKNNIYFNVNHRKKNDFMCWTKFSCLFEVVAQKSFLS